MSIMMAKEILKLMVDKNMKKSTVAEKCGWSPANFYNKLRYDDFRTSELKLIGEAMECELKIEFIPIKKDEQQ